MADRAAWIAIGQGSRLVLLVYALLVVLETIGALLIARRADVTEVEIRLRLIGFKIRLGKTDGKVQADEKARADRVGEGNSIERVRPLKRVLQLSRGLLHKRKHNS